MVLGLELKNLDGKIACNVCIRSKITCKPLPKEPGECSKNLKDKIYSNVWGLARHITIDKKIYYVSFTNNYSRESVLYLMSSKDQVFRKYKLYEAMMLHQWNVHIKTLLSDRGGEYTSANSINIWNSKA